MSQKSGPEGLAEIYVKKTRRKTRRKFSAEEKVRVGRKGFATSTRSP